MTEKCFKLDFALTYLKWCYLNRKKINPTPVFKVRVFYYCAQEIADSNHLMSSCLTPG